MFPHESPKLTRQAVLLAMISAAFPAVGYGAAGRVDFSSGDASVVGRDGAPRPLARGDEVNSGDTISTNRGRAQVRFTDGAFVSIQPETTFRVDEYSYGGKPDGSEKGFFSLLKGAMRTVTGAIGKVNRQAYQVYTPSATIGIRGTGYVVTVTNPTELYCWEGQCLLQNDKGSVGCDAGQTCRAASRTSAPENTGQPGAGPGPDPLTGQGSGEDGTPGGNLPVSLSEPGPSPALTNALVQGANDVSMAIAHDTGGGNSNGFEVPLAVATLDGSLGLESFVSPSFGENTRGTNQLVDVGVDPGGIGLDPQPGQVAWGRWTGGVVGGTGSLANLDLTGGEGHNLHYIVGVPTSLADMESLSSRDVVATYTLIGGTPTTQNGQVGSAPTSGSLVAAFQQRSVAVEMVVPAPNATYGYSANGFISGSTFTGGGSATCISGCSSSPSVGLAGFFAGANAARAGIVYGIFEPGAHILGAAGFAKTSESIGSGQARPP